MTVSLPSGFAAHVANVGIKDDSDDFAVVVSERRCAAAGVFTRSRFVGPSVILSRRHLADRSASAVVVVSKNANVANGATGLADAQRLCAGVAAAIGCEATDVVVASTGVIGRRYPMERIESGLAGLPTRPLGTDATAVARAMMTTDTHPKVASAAAGEAQVVGVAKGAGMIEPDMATLLAFLFTDAELPPDQLDAVFRRQVDRTLNSLSVDTDTSTSDTACILANGEAGPVEEAALESAVEEVLTDLTRQLARDGEGATKLLGVTVGAARDADQARRVAKSVVNSPLVKTAVHGADPNWGRVAMAIGKCTGETDVDQERVRIAFGGQECYPTRRDDGDLAALARYLEGDAVDIGVELGTGSASWTVYGCDLSDGYVRINADYTT